MQASITTAAHAREAGPRQHADQHASGSRPPDRRPRSAAACKEPHDAQTSSTPPRTGSPSGTSTASSYARRSSSGLHPTEQSPRMPLGDILGVLRDAYCRTIGVEYMHIQERRGEGVDPVATSRRRGPPQRATRTRSATFSFRSERRPRRSRQFLGHQATSARNASAWKAPRAAIPILDAVLSESAADDGQAHRSSSAWPTAAVSTCWSTSSASPTKRCSEEFEGGLRRALHPGLRRREVPPGCRDRGVHLTHEPCNTIPMVTLARQPVAPRSRGPGGAWV